MASKQDSAETLAIEALAWLAGNDELLPRFLAASGASLGSLAADVANPAVLGAVLDFLMNEDAWVIAFCDATGHAYDQPMRARAHLPGGEASYWT